MNLNVLEKEVNVEILEKEVNEFHSCFYGYYIEYKGNWFMWDNYLNRYIYDN